MYRINTQPIYKPNLQNRVLEIGDTYRELTPVEEIQYLLKTGDNGEPDYLDNNNQELVNQWNQMNGYGINSDQGGVFPIGNGTFWTNLGGFLGNGLGNFFGNNQPAPPPQNNTPIYIALGGFGFLTIILIIILFFKK